MFQRLLLMALLAQVFLLGCGSDSQNSPVGTTTPPPGILFQQPASRATRVDPERENLIRVHFDRPVTQRELDLTQIQINGVDAERQLNASNQTLILRHPEGIDYHEFVEVILSPTGPGGLAKLSWSFATSPGPAGLLWQRIEAPTQDELHAVLGGYLTYWAIGNSGTFLRSESPLDPFRWRPSASYFYSSVGDPYQGDLLRVHGWGSRSAVISGDGQLFIDVGYTITAVLGQPMVAVDLPGVFARDETLLGRVVVGSPRDDLDAGLIVDAFNQNHSFEAGPGRALHATDYSDTGVEHYLAVGENGTVFYSEDRIGWQQVGSADWGDLGAVQGAFVRRNDTAQRAVAAGDNIIWSDDGKAWNLASRPGSGPLNQITWSIYSKSYIAVGDAGALLTSEDGANWSAIETGLDLIGVDLNDIWVHDTKWIAVGSGGVTLMTPPDALTF